MHALECQQYIKLRVCNQRTEVANGQKLISNLTNNVCKPGETFNLFRNQSTTPKTNLTSTENVTASQIQNNTGSTANVGRTISQWK